MLDQLERIRRNLNGEAPPEARLQLRFVSSEPPQDVLDRTREVMKPVAAAQGGEWPSDAAWRDRLPSWFLRTFDGHSLEEIIENVDLWDFGSWLDAMKDPGWEWWSSQSLGDIGIVQCMAHADPFAIEPLIYLLQAAGGSDIDLQQG